MGTDATSIGIESVEVSPEETLEVEDDSPATLDDAGLPSLEQAIQRLESAGWQVEATDAPADYLVQSPGSQSKMRYPKGALPLLAIELPHDFTPLENLVAHVSIDNRLVEFLLRSTDSIRLGRRGLPQSGNCPHDTKSSSHLRLFPNARAQLEAGGKTSDIWTHVHDPRTGTCIEISMASATLGFRYAELNERGNWPISMSEVSRFWSVKVRFVSDFGRNGAVQLAEELARSTMFDAAAAFRISMSIVPKVGRNLYRARLSPSPSALRFPAAKFHEQAAALFQLASDTYHQTLINRYILYYQSVEYFLPLHDERESISQIRRTLNSPLFNLSRDEDVLSLVGILGRRSFKGERETFVEMAERSVSEARVREFLEHVGTDLPDHFGKRGPIKHVAVLNPADPNQNLVRTAANRIYDIRCRIVHSKAGGGRDGVDPIFPTDREANALHPDLELVRLVAIEIISAFAGSLSFARPN